MHIISANVSGVGSLTKWLKQSPITARFIPVQEHHLAGNHHEDEHNLVGSLQSQADKSGYTGCFGNAIATDEGGASGGVGFLWAKAASVSTPIESLPGRLAAMTCTTNFGTILLLNLYGQTRATPSRSAAILHKAFEHAGQIAKPAIIAGDFNQAPHQVQAFIESFNFPYGKHTEQHTCETASGFSTLDFFIVHQSLAEVASLPTLAHDHSLKTHTPVQLFLRQALLDTPVQVLPLQPRSSPTAVIGPHWPPNKFEDTWTPSTGQKLKL
jgi:endonuclease/exonuclease/phosphatase family metal-dependent hydrolase